MVADWNTASDQLVVYSSHQAPHFLRTFLAIVCGVSELKVRAIAPDVGGGFGSELNAYARVPRGRRIAEGRCSRQEDRRAVGGDGRDLPRAGAERHNKLALTNDGKVLAMRVHYVQHYGPTFTG